MEPYGGMTFEEFWKLPAEVCEAVNKQIPVKPLVNRISEDVLYDVVQCARCHRRLRTEKTRDKYCPSCGQKVKWEE